MDTRAFPDVSDLLTTELESSTIKQAVTDVTVKITNLSLTAVIFRKMTSDKAAVKLATVFWTLKHSVDVVFLLPFIHSIFSSLVFSFFHEQT